MRLKDILTSRTKPKTFEELEQIRLDLEERKRYNKKIVISGNVVEEYDYKWGKKVLGKKIKNPNSIPVHTSKSDEHNQEQNFRRSKQMLKRIINSNSYQYGNLKPVFLTLTFKDEVEDIDFAKDCFKQFVKKVKYYTGSKMAYVCVPEIQKERFEKYGCKVWHFHLVIFNLPFVEKEIVCQWWSHGFIDIKALMLRKKHKSGNWITTNKELLTVGEYVTKYMSKDFVEVKKNSRKYFPSQGLKRPIAHYVVDEKPNNSPHIFRQNLCDDFNGFSIYKKYNKKKYKKDLTGLVHSAKL